LIAGIAGAWLRGYLERQGLPKQLREKRIKGKSTYYAFDDKQNQWEKIGRDDWIRLEEHYGSAEVPEEGTYIYSLQKTFKQGGPTKEKWFDPKMKLGGWNHTMDAKYRRQRAFSSTDKRKDRHDRYVQAGRKLQALANVNQSEKTKIVAKADADYFFEMAEKHPKAMEHGGPTQQYPPLNSVDVIFENSEYNYTTSVSAKSTEESIRKYFVGSKLDVGVYPKEQMEEVIDIKFHKGGKKMGDGGEITAHIIGSDDMTGDPIYKGSDGLRYMQQGDTMYLINDWDEPMFLVTNVKIVEEMEDGGSISAIEWVKWYPEQWKSMGEEARDEYNKGKGDAKYSLRKSGKGYMLEKEHIFKEDEFIKKKVDYFTPSGLGGAWKLRFVDKEGDKYHYHREAHGDWPEDDFYFTKSDLPYKITIESVYDLPVKSQEMADGGSTNTFATEILSQLGGNMFMAMTGAHTFLYDEKSRFLSFRIPKNDSKANYVRITLTPADTYTMEFGKVTKKDPYYKKLDEFENIYADQLGQAFTKYTGFDVRLADGGSITNTIYKHSPTDILYVKEGKGRYKMLNKQAVKNLPDSEMELYEIKEGQDRVWSLVDGNDRVYETGLTQFEAETLNMRHDGNLYLQDSPLEMRAGGRVSIKDADIKVGSKFYLPNGETIEIKRLFKENIDEDWVEYTREGGSGSQQGKNEGSVKSLRQFLNNFQATESNRKMEDGGSVNTPETRKEIRSKISDYTKLVEKGTLYEGQKFQVVWNDIVYGDKTKEGLIDKVIESEEYMQCTESMGSGGKVSISGWENKLLSKTGKQMTPKRKEEHIAWQLKSDKARLQDLVDSRKKIVSTKSNMFPSEIDKRTKKQILQDFDEYIRPLKESVDYKTEVLKSLKGSIKMEDGGSIEKSAIEHIASRSGVTKEAVRGFVDTHSFSAQQLAEKIGSGEVEGIDLSTAILGVPGNEYEQKIVELLEVGGKGLPNQYKGKTPEEVWTKLSTDQRRHFLEDHGLGDYIAAQNVGYKFISEEIKKVLKTHTDRGQYRHGGGVNHKIRLQRIMLESEV